MANPVKREPVISAGLVAGLVGIVITRYFPEADIPEEVVIGIVAVITMLARQFVSPSTSEQIRQLKLELDQAKAAVRNRTPGGGVSATLLALALVAPAAAAAQEAVNDLTTWYWERRDTDDARTQSAARAWFAAQETACTDAGGAWVQSGSQPPVCRPLRIATDAAEAAPEPDLDDVEAARVHYDARDHPNPQARSAARRWLDAAARRCIRAGGEVVDLKESPPACRPRMALNANANANAVANGGDDAGSLCGGQMDAERCLELIERLARGGLDVDDLGITANDRPRAVCDQATVNSGDTITCRLIGVRDPSDWRIRWTLERVSGSGSVGSIQDATGADVAVVTGAPGQYRVLAVVELRSNPAAVWDDDDLPAEFTVTARHGALARFWRSASTWIGIGGGFGGTLLVCHVTKRCGALGGGAQ